MKSALNDKTLMSAVIATEVMILVTSIHHVYRLGLELLIPAAALLVIPILIAWWHRRGSSRLSALAFGAYTAGVFFYFGIVDGFLDHVLKAVGLENTTFLPGSEAEVVATVFHLWSTEAGHVFYEATGILTFLSGLVAMYFSYRLVRRSFRVRAAATVAVTPAG